MGINILTGIFGNKISHVPQGQVKQGGISGALVNAKTEVRIAYAESIDLGASKKHGSYCKVKAWFKRGGKSVSAQPAQRNVASQAQVQMPAMISAEKPSRDDALQLMREALRKSDPENVEKNFAAWLEYERRIDSEMCGYMDQEELSLRTCIQKFTLQPDAPKAKSNLISILDLLGSVVPKAEGGSGEMFAAARQASLVTPQMEEIGEHAAEAEKLLNTTEPLIAGSAGFRQITNWCNKLLSTLTHHRSKLSTVRDFSAVAKPSLPQTPVASVAAEEPLYAVVDPNTRTQRAQKPVISPKPETAPPPVPPHMPMAAQPVAAPRRWINDRPVATPRTSKVTPLVPAGSQAIAGKSDAKA